jgi:hypothetical protein
MKWELIGQLVGCQVVALNSTYEASGDLHPSAIQILKGKTYIHYLGTCENRLKSIHNFLLG